MIVNNPDHLPHHLMTFTPDLVGLYGLSCSVHIIRDCATVTKKHRSTLPVIVGGVAATLSPEVFEPPLHSSGIDVVFSGEAEITFPLFVDSFSENRTLPETKSISGEVVVDLDRLPFVDRASYENGEIKHPLLFHYPGRMYSMLNSRWCRKNCRFCAPASKTIFGGIKKLRSVTHFIEELHTLPRDFILMIHDDNLIENESWAIDFIEGYSKFKRPFICQGYPAEIVRSKFLLSELKKIGLVGMLVGFESGSDRMLQHMRKGTSLDINIAAAHLLHELKINIQANLMFGSPTETYAEMMATVRMFNNHIYPAVASPAIYTPYPGSYWYEELNAHNQIAITHPRQYDRSPVTANKLIGVDYGDVQHAIFLLKDDLPPIRRFKKQLRFYINRLRHFTQLN
jgi:radical SAM superfamily enzyme YgiQ (UPF0313 family)